eukprot:4967148-Prymnesium_polylepis.1
MSCQGWAGGRLRACLPRELFAIRAKENTRRRRRGRDPPIFGISPRPWRPAGPIDPNESSRIFPQSHEITAIT